MFSDFSKCSYYINSDNSYMFIRSPEVELVISLPTLTRREETEYTYGNIINYRYRAVISFYEETKNYGRRLLGIKEDIIISMYNIPCDIDVKYIACDIWTNLQEKYKKDLDNGISNSIRDELKYFDLTSLPFGKLNTNEYHKKMFRKLNSYPLTISNPRDGCLFLNDESNGTGISLVTTDTTVNSCLNNLPEIIKFAYNAGLRYGQDKIRHMLLDFINGRDIE